MCILVFCGVVGILLLFFFFKQKTAYQMRISDWSSDVFSSDLAAGECERRYDQSRNHTETSIHDFNLLWKMSKSPKMAEKAASESRGSGAPATLIDSPEQDGPPSHGTIGAGMKPE